MAQNSDPSSEVRDPVCGKVVDPLRARAVGIFGGATVYFCSQGCKAEYGDPRKAGPEAPPPAVERRLNEREDGTGEWFAGRTTQAAQPPAVDSFSDLEAGAAPTQAQPPTPSLMIDVRSARRAFPWTWVIIVATVVLGILYLTLGGPWG